MDDDLIGVGTVSTLIVMHNDDEFWEVPVVYEHYVDGELVGTLSMTVEARKMPHAFRQQALSRFISNHKRIKFFGRSDEAHRLAHQQRVDALETWRSLPWWRRLFTPKPF